MYFAVVAGISCLLSLLWLLPSKGGFAHCKSPKPCHVRSIPLTTVIRSLGPVDVLVSFAWIAVFALLVNWMATGKCKDSTNTLGDMNLHDYCGRGRANEALSILSAILWLLSAIVGLWFIHRESRKKKRDTVVTLSQGA